MRFTYDYSKDTVSTGGVEYELAPIRSWLKKNYDELVFSHFVKTIISKGAIMPTFDWYSIYQAAEDMGIMHLYFSQYQK